MPPTNSENWFINGFCASRTRDDEKAEPWTATPCLTELGWLAQSHHQRGNKLAPPNTAADKAGRHCASSTSRPANDTPSLPSKA